MKTTRVRSEAVESQLVETLFNQTTSLMVGGFVLALVALVGLIRTGQIWFLAWAVATVIVLTARLVLQRAFARRGGSIDRTAAWRQRFIIGAWAMGVLWGFGALVVVTKVDPFTQMFIITGQTVIIMGAAARNAGCVVAANGQVYLGFTPLFVACLVSSDPTYRVLCLFIVFAAFAAVELARASNENTVRLLCVNEENSILVREIKRVNEGLAAANCRLEAAATTDALTEIANRRRFDAVLLDECGRARRDPTDLSLLLLDVDLFKGFNDRYGHQAGDDCLQRIAAALSAALQRPADLGARYGGEEFAAILPQTNVASAAAFAERLRADIEALAIANAGGIEGIVTVSIGVASYSADGCRQPGDFIRAADEALYAAKGAGRNCVRVAGETTAGNVLRRELPHVALS